MFKLRNIRASNIDQRPILLDNAVSDERPHAKMIALRSKMLEVTSGEDQGPKVIVDSLQQRLSGGVMEATSPRILVAAVAVHAGVVVEVGFAGAAKGLYRKYVALFHALVGFGLNEGDLFVTMDFVAENVVARDVLHGFDWDGLPIYFHFVALHYFLYHLADVVNPGIDSSFLS